MKKAVLTTWYPDINGFNDRSLQESESQQKQKKFTYVFEYEIEKVPQSEKEILPIEVTDGTQAAATAVNNLGNFVVTLGIFSGRFMIKIMSIIYNFKLLLMYPIQLPDKVVST